MKKIKDFENYSINENGTVINTQTNLVKKPYINKDNGYLYVDLYKNNKSHKKPIHRLIAESFIPNPLNKKTVDHIDGNRLNNSISNLRWATYSEQNSRFDTSGVRSEKIKVTKYEEVRNKRGGGHIAWIEENVKVIEFDSITECAKYFSKTISNISLLLKTGTIGKRGTTRGYKFEYLNGSRKTYNQKGVTTIPQGSTLK